MPLTLTQIKDKLSSVIREQEDKRKPSLPDEPAPETDSDQSGAATKE